ncbi:MAG: ABC1 kinase family protein [Candidatus Cyclobacteriaceae bacterium M3_2C_046]
MSLSGLPFKTRNFSRVRKVLSIFIKYGFDDIVAHTQLNNIISRKKISSLKKEGHQITANTRFERIRMVFEELGPTYIKLGQILSNRQDILPKDLITQFERLQDNVAPEKDFSVRQILSQQLQIDPDQHFLEIQEKPIASASIAQVHKAKLKSGEWVMFKIQRPSIREVIKADLEIIRYIVRQVMKRWPEFAAYRPLDLLKSFERSIRLELSFNLEASNINRFKNNFKNDRRVYVPEIFRQFCNDSILCMEQVVGTKISDLPELKKKEIDLEKIIDAGVDVYFKQVFEFGYFHADPHPGNILILNDERICFLDFGMMGVILPQDRELISEMVINIMRQDLKRLIRNIEMISTETNIQDHKTLEYDLFDLIQEVNSASIKDLRMEMLYEKFRTFFYTHRIVIPADLYLLMRAFVVLEGLGLMIKPEFNMMEAMKPYAKTLIWKKYQPKNMLESSFSSILDIRDLFKQFPGDLKLIMEKVKEGKLKIEFAHMGLEGFYASLDRVTNRLSLAIITSALIIGSSLVVLSGVPPKIFNIPLFGLIGFLISVVLAIWIIISIIKKNKI